MNNTEKMLIAFTKMIVFDYLLKDESQRDLSKVKLVSTRKRLEKQADEILMLASNHPNCRVTVQDIKDADGLKTLVETTGAFQSALQAKREIYGKQETHQNDDRLLLGLVTSDYYINANGTKRLDTKIKKHSNIQSGKINGFGDLPHKIDKKFLRRFKLESQFDLHLVNKRLEKEEKQKQASQKQEQIKQEQKIIESNAINSLVQTNQFIQ